MDNSIPKNSGGDRHAGFFADIKRNLNEDGERGEKRIDDFFDKVENTKRGRINDEPVRQAGKRYVAKDSEVFVFRDGEDGGFKYSANGDGGRTAVSADGGRGVRKAAVEPQNGKKAKGGGRRPPKAPKPAKKRSVVGIIFGIIGRLILGIGCLVTIAGCVAAVLASVYLVNVTKDDGEILNLNNIELTYASSIMYRPEGEGGAWEEYQRIFGTENRIWVKYADMPKHLIQAIVASEDQRFWEHDGVDWKMTLGAFANAYIPGLDIYDTARGGSTIVQQLIKNITDEKETKGFDGALRKLREIYRALVMEKNYSRYQILESYLNTFRLTGQVAGIEAAANYYFDKETKDLTVAECAGIICITKSPGLYNPYTHPDENKLQRDTILIQMNEQGYFKTEQEYRRAREESDNLVFSEPKEIYTGVNIQTWFADMVIQEVVDDFVKYEFNGVTTAAEAFAELSSGGYRVNTTLDTKVQAAMDDVMLNGRETEEDERYQYPNQEDGYIFPIYDSRPVEDPETGEYVVDAEGNRVMNDEQPQSAFVVMDMKGRILGVVGGLGEKKESMSFNRATDGTRSTGSSMKPVAAYGPAIEANAIHFSTLFPDDPLPDNTAGPGVTGWPRNYSRTYGPPVTVASGIAQSLNTTAVFSLHQVGIDFSFDFMKLFLGMESLDDPGDRTYSLALGGLYNGVTPVEMCAAYAAFGNGGYYYTPHSYTQILNAQGEVVFDKTDYIQTIKAFKDDTAYIMNRLLYNVMHPGLSGTGVNALPDGDLDYVGKSGTHTDNMDMWFVGMNPYYVMAVWEGYDEQAEMDDPRPHPVQLAFKKVMSEISSDLEPIDFPVPETGVKQMRFCMASGDLASPECTNTRIGYYKDSFIPPVCNHASAPDPNDPAYAWPRPTAVPVVTPPA